MKGELQKRRILGRGKEVFIGVDVHKESWHVTARTEGEEVFHGGVSRVNIMPCKGSLVTSRIVRWKRQLSFVLARSVTKS
jgi:hypothetical protein